MKHCVYAECLEARELAVAMEIFKGYLVAIAAVAFCGAFLIPDEQKFCLLGYCPTMKYYLLASVMMVSLGIFCVRAVRKPLAWCRPCKEAGELLCYCRTPFRIESKYRFVQFLHVIVFTGLIGKCPNCGISFPVGRQQKLLASIIVIQEEDCCHDSKVRSVVCR
jgi:hypothetical protein